VTGLPDGIFSKPKSRFGQILEGLELENVGIFYGHIIRPFVLFHGHLVYFMAIWYILWPLVNLVAICMVYFPPFWHIVSKKSVSPG
jgi:hypothetical protein